MSSSATSDIQINSNANTVIALNTHAFLKLNSSNFPALHVQFYALLVGYDLIGYVDGTKLMTFQLMGCCLDGGDMVDLHLQFS